MKISEILAKYDTDKTTVHSYGEIYNKIFERFDRNDKINLMEIGVEKGGSMMAWREYFPNANILGVDLSDQRLPEYLRKDIEYVFKDIKNPETTNLLADRTFDVIIDDSCHILSFSKFIVETYLRKLKVGGVLIVEDCQEPDKWVSEIQSVVNNEFSLTPIDLRGIKGRWDDFMITIERG